MSWSFNLVSQNSKTIQDEIAKHESCPEKLREHLSQTLDSMMERGLEDGMAFHVESSGHHDPNYQSYGNFKVEKVKAV